MSKKVDPDSVPDLDFVEYSDDDKPARIIPNIEDCVDSQGRLLNQQPQYDKLINAEVLLQLGEEMLVGKVKKRNVDHAGHVSGSYDSDPLKNTILYEVEFDDGQIKEYSANLIAENMLSQVDSDGNVTPLLAGIIEYVRDPSVAVLKKDGYVYYKDGRRRLRKTTAGYKFLVEWADGSESYVPLKDMKESFPLETAEFAKARNIDKDPAFQWWVNASLRQRDVILSKVIARVKRNTQKYGIELPFNVNHAMDLDRKDSSTIWRDALNKEMYEVCVAFEMLDEEVSAPPGWTKVSGHLIWDLKMDFTCKA